MAWVATPASKTTPAGRASTPPPVIFVTAAKCPRFALPVSSARTAVRGLRVISSATAAMTWAGVVPPGPALIRIVSRFANAS